MYNLISKLSNIFAYRYPNDSFTLESLIKYGQYKFVFIVTIGIILLPYRTKLFIGINVREIHDCQNRERFNPTKNSSQ